MVEMAGIVPTKVRATVARDWEQFALVSAIKTYKAATPLFRQGAPARNVYLILDGVIKLIHSEQDGKETIMGLAFPVGLLGAAPAILAKTYPLTATTLTRTSLLCASGDDFVRLVRSDAQFSFQLQRMLSEEIYEQCNHLAELCLVPARQRLERLIRKLVATQKREQFQHNVPLKHWEIAALLAITPEHLSRLLKVMAREGNLRQEKGKVNLLDPKMAA